MMTTLYTIYTQLARDKPTHSKFFLIFKKKKKKKEPTLTKEPPNSIFDTFRRLVSHDEIRGSSHLLTIA